MFYWSEAYVHEKIVNIFSGPLKSGKSELNNLSINLLMPCYILKDKSKPFNFLFSVRQKYETCTLTHRVSFNY